MSQVTSLRVEPALRRLVCALVLALGLCAAPAWADEPVQPELWTTNGTVLAATLSGNTLYIGGTFSYVGPCTGSGVPIDAGSGQPAVPFPKVDGAVHAVAADGNGGWYIGGNFSRVGAVYRPFVAHILPDYTVDLAWNANANGLVRALAVSGSTVYAGGYFASIGGQARNRIAALDAATGLATAWNPNANSDVYALAVSSDGSLVYAGGDFGSVGGRARSFLAALDAANGTATGWNPNANNSVRALLVHPDGSAVYAGGFFTAIGGQARNRIAALDVTTGAATSWNPNANSAVRALAVSPDASTVYVGGDLTTIGGQPRNRVAAVGAAGAGAPTGWNPNADGTVYALAVSGATVYVGGYFWNIGGQARNHIVALDAGTGQATAWDPSASNAVRALGVNGSTVYAGGDFTMLGGQARSRLAALDVATGAVTAWNPAVNGTSVNALALSPDGGTVYVGGNFTAVGNQVRFQIAAVNVVTGLPTAWDPNPGNGTMVVALALNGDGSIIYAGGTFTTIGGQARNRIAALDAATGAATAWNPNASGSIEALAQSPDGATLYAGGNFTTIGGQARNRIAALDAATGAATAWNPNASSSIIALALSPDGATVYAGGEFSTIGGQTRSRIAALDAATGLATAWNPNASTTVRALVLSGPTIYAGGSFLTIGGQERWYVAALDTTTGQATLWNPNASNAVYGLALGGSTVYAGGGFSRVGGQYRPYLAAIYLPGRTWNGSAGTDWQAAANWTPAAAPSLSSEVVIPAAPASQPVIGPGQSAAVANLRVEPGALLALADGTAGLTVEGTLTNDGALRQTRSVPRGVVTQFLYIQNAAGSGGRYWGVGVQPTSSDMNATTVTIYGHQTCANGNTGVWRCFEIVPTTPQPAYVTFYYRDAEENGQSAPRVWHWDSATAAWNEQNFLARNTGGVENNWVQATVGGSYSPFALGDAMPTAVDLLSFGGRLRPRQIELAWETASEVDTAGFYLYRAEASAGPFVRLTGSLVPARAPGSPAGARYVWLDGEVRPGTTYHYRLEEVDMHGGSTFYGPVTVTAGYWWYLPVVRRQ